MLDHRTRALMRRIAAGLPLAIPLLAAPFNVGGCYPLGYQCPVEIRSELVEYTPPDGGVLDPDGQPPLDCAEICGEGTGCEVADESHVACLHSRRVCPAAGRLPDAPTYARQSRSSDGVVRWLETTAALEAASVVAFERMAADLQRLGAPASLVEGATRAADDERRHAQQISALSASRGGARRAEVHVRVVAPPSLGALATHNAAEGCVNEAFGALEACAMASRAADGDVREVMRAIARDEAGHALLSMRIDDWARAGLEDDRELDVARRQARRELARHLESRTRPAGLGLLSLAEAAPLVIAPEPRAQAT